jgi:diguanylate cyclase (GGDEF)-like protein
MSDPHERDIDFEAAPCGLLTLSSHGVVERVNQTFLDWTGFEAAALVGSPFAEVLTPGSQIFWETRHLPTLRLRGEVREVALSLRRADDAPLAILVNSTIGGASNPVGAESAAEVIRVAIFDSTARQDYERELLGAQRIAEASESRVRTLQIASSAFGVTQSEDELAQVLASSARDAMAANTVAVILLDPAGNEYVAAGEHLLDEFASSAEARSALDLIAQTDSTVFASTAEVEIEFAELAEAMRVARLETFSVTKLATGYQTVGTLFCFFGRQRDLAEQDTDLQLALARQAAQSIVRIRLQKQLEALAMHDQLTGLANRTLLRESLVQALGSALWNDHAMALIFIDLDGFKAVNDSLGHSVGDDLLKWAAGEMLRAVRSDDVVGRFGGDEFVVICEGTDAVNAMHVAERLLVALRQRSGIVPDSVVISASIGVALVTGEPGPNTTPEAVFVAADAAMYRSKESGKDRITLVEL